MQKLIIPLLAFVFTMGVAGGVDAAKHKRHVRHVRSGHATVHYRNIHRYRDDDTIGGYYEHRLEAVRFGSQRWWHIYDEQHGGRRR